MSDAQQARRLSDSLALVYLGKLIEVAKKSDLFDHPNEKRRAAT